MNKEKKFTKLINVENKCTLQEVPTTEEDQAYFKAWETIKAYIKEKYKGTFKNGFEGTPFKTMFYLDVVGHKKSLRIDEFGNAYIYETSGYHIDKPRKDGSIKRCSEFNFNEDSCLSQAHMAAIVNVVDNWRDIKAEVEDRAYALKKVYEFKI